MNKVVKTKEFKKLKETYREYSKNIDNLCLSFRVLSDELSRENTPYILGDTPYLPINEWDFLCQKLNVICFNLSKLKNFSENKRILFETSKDYMTQIRELLSHSYETMEKIADFTVNDEDSQPLLDLYYKVLRVIAEMKITKLEMNLYDNVGELFKLKFSSSELNDSVLAL